MDFGKKHSLKALAPCLSFKEEIAGRETLAAIAQDRGESITDRRGPATTTHYGDRISNAPGAMSAKVAKALDDAPEISISYDTFERTDLAHPSNDSLQGYLPRHDHRRSVNPSEENQALANLSFSETVIEQLHTFVVECAPEQLASGRTKRALVCERLLRQIPYSEPEHIRRIDVRSGNREGTSIVRVWVLVPR